MRYSIMRKSDKKVVGTDVDLKWAFFVASKRQEHEGGEWLVYDDLANLLGKFGPESAAYEMPKQQPFLVA